MVGEQKALPFIMVLPSTHPPPKMKAFLGIQMSLFCHFSIPLFFLALFGYGRGRERSQRPCTDAAAQREADSSTTAELRGSAGGGLSTPKVEATTLGARGYDPRSAEIRWSGVSGEFQGRDKAESGR